MILYEKSFMKERFGYSKSLKLGSSFPSHRAFLERVIEKNRIRTIFDGGCAKGNNFTYLFVQKVSPQGVVYSVELDSVNVEICKFLYSEGSFSKYSNNIRLYQDTALNVLQKIKKDRTPIELFFLDTTPDLTEEFEFILQNWKNVYVFTHDWFKGKCSRIRKKYSDLCIELVKDDPGLALFKF